MEYTSNPCEEHEMVVDNTELPSASQEKISDSQIDNWNDHNWADKLLTQLFTKKCEDNCKNPASLEEFISNDDFLKVISTPVDKSIGEIFMMIVKFSISNCLSVTAMTNLFKLVNTIFETPILPESRHIMDKLLNHQNGIQFHAVCPNCSAYLREFGKIESTNFCGICKYQVDLLAPSRTSFFILIDPSKQISDLLHLSENHYEFVVKERRQKKDHIEDVYDGKAYREFVNSLSTEDKHNYVTTVLNTDGAPKFKSSKMSIWPLHLKINELPPQDRMNKLVTCGLWFNRKKPEMTVFLDKFVDLINNVTVDGIPCKIKGEERLLKLHVLNSCVDSPARAAMQGIKQYNRNYSCNWCPHPGVYAEGSMKFPVICPPPKERTHNETVDLMLKATPENPEFGVKNPSPLINLPKFNIIDGFVPDYMHCCLEGVASQFTIYWQETMNSQQIENIDSMMQKITVPDQITRLCTPFSLKNDYKAREWENFILYYSCPIFSTILPQDKFDHWLLFVEALHILLQRSIHIDLLNRADELLHLFNAKTKSLYGLKSMTHNVHQLLHISESVLKWGPLWTNSTFGFESANYYLIKAIKCSRGITQQNLRYININHSSLILQDYLSRQASNEVMMYCNDILTSKMQNITRSNEIVYFGNSSSVELDTRVRLKLNRSSTLCYSKIIKDRCLYESSAKLKTRSNNSFAILEDGKFIRITGFIFDELRRTEYTVCNIVHTNNAFPRAYKMLQRIEKIDNEPKFIQTKNIKGICVFIKVNSKMYLCPVPNMLHY